MLLINEVLDRSRKALRCISLYITGVLSRLATNFPVMVGGGGAAQSSAVHRARSRRVFVPVGFAVVLVGVPTVFAIFPGLAQWPTPRKLGVTAAWVVLAFLGAILTARADQHLHEVVATESESIVVAEHRATIREVFSTLLQPAIGGIPEQYHLSVYAPSPDKRFLVPVFPAAVNFSDPAIFPVDAGAVGKAWTAGTGVVVIKGSAVSDRSHGLTALQSRRYGIFGTVAATTIRDERDEPIGVLCAIGRDDDGFFDTGDGARLMRSLAESVAWLIPDAVRWMVPRDGVGA